ncbi:beta-N-acetylhexosaminidase [Roseovarius autotrophicus]|uniref:beta-N-acetylhexosaminidase n=1 Tax=Roseovarius autotrophicus TaxID=2824121 RepID=UPI001A037A8C|nr:beta-N-acetylhexosaminidase [Roseovarius sp.]
MSRYGAVILDASGLRLTPEERTFFRDTRPFGFILFARNIDTPDQVRALIAELREAAGHEAVITIDQEGGRVQRLRAPVWRDWPAPLDHVAAAGERAPEAMYLRYRLIAAELHALGIDSNCAPLVDVAGSATHPFLRNRCYGEAAGRVADIGRAVAEGLLAGGVLPVVKHIPGHGRASADSHHDLPRVECMKRDLQDIDFKPFKALSDLPMAMTAHVVYAALDDRPATLSPTLIATIRDEIGFDGLLMTDDIAMKALSGDLAALSRQALAAGCDMILHCNGTLAERRTVVEAAGEMTEAAQVRAERAMACRCSPDPVDIFALAAQLDALTGGRVHG